MNPSSPSARWARPLFWVYFLVLCWLFLIKDWPEFIALWKIFTWERLFSFTRYSNLVPGRTLLYYVTLQENAWMGLRQIGGNLAGFVPFGVLLPIWHPKVRTSKELFAAALATSLGFELFQLFSGTGSFDVDDLLLNVSGAVCGFFALRWWLKEVRQNGNGK